MIWNSLSVSVSAGATVIESPVWMPIGSTFSIEQTMMQLSVSVADDLHLELLPAEHRFLDQHLGGRRGVEAALDDLEELLAVVGDAAAGAAEREGGADDRRQADDLQRLQRVDQRVRQLRARRLQADPLHRLAEELAVLGLVDGLGRGADHLDAELLEHAHLAQRQRRVERRLAAHGRQQHQLVVRPRGALLLDDLRDDLRRDRLDIGGVGQLRVGHDRGRVGVDQHDPVALGLERLHGLGAGIVELAGLADDDRAGADDRGSSRCRCVSAWRLGSSRTKPRRGSRSGANPKVFQARRGLYGKPGRARNPRRNGRAAAGRVAHFLSLPLTFCGDNKQQGSARETCAMATITLKEGDFGGERRSSSARRRSICPTARGRD